VQDRTHGPQFKATWIRVSPPDSPEGVERYLGSGLIKGIGPHLAKQLVDAFAAGEGMAELAQRNGLRLRTVEDILRIKHALKRGRLCR
jgi:exodeoxyribonuclease V alpha subunit